MKILKKLKIRLEIRKREKRNKLHNEAWDCLNKLLNVIGSDTYMNPHFDYDVRAMLNKTRRAMDTLFEKQMENIAELYKLDKELKNV